MYQGERKRPKIKGLKIGLIPDVVALTLFGLDVCSDVDDCFGFAPWTERLPGRYEDNAGFISNQSSPRTPLPTARMILAFVASSTYFFIPETPAVLYAFGSFFSIADATILHRKRLVLSDAYCSLKNFTMPSKRLMVSGLRGFDSIAEPDDTELFGEAFELDVFLGSIKSFVGAWCPTPPFC